MNDRVDGCETQRTLSALIEVPANGFLLLFEDTPFWWLEREAKRRQNWGGGGGGRGLTKDTPIAKGRPFRGCIRMAPGRGKVLEAKARKNCPKQALGLPGCHFHSQAMVVETRCFGFSSVDGRDQPVWYHAPVISIQIQSDMFGPGVARGWSSATKSTERVVFPI